MKRVNFVRLLPIATVLFFASCNKDKVTAISEDLIADLMMQKTEQVGAKDADELTLKCLGCGPEEMRACIDDCAQITDSGEGLFPRTITIDYGTNGCGDDDKHQKKGKVVITVSADMATVGAVRTLSYEDFYVGERKMDGTRKLTNVSSEANVNVVFAYDDNIIMTHNGKIRSKTASGTHTWIVGFDTKEDKTDDIFEISGRATMSCNKGEATRQIIVPIVFDAACGYPVSGIVEMTDPEGNTHGINFGDGTCDNEATLTHDGETEVIDLDEMRTHGKPHHRRKKLLE